MGYKPQVTDKQAKPRGSPTSGCSHSGLVTGCSGEAHAAYLKAEEFRLDRRGFLHGLPSTAQSWLLLHTVLRLMLMLPCCVGRGLAQGKTLPDLGTSACPR